MSRRATNSDYTHHKRVKEEKIKIKEERSKGKQRARVDEEQEEQRQRSPDADGDEDDAGEPDDESGSARGSKRIRVNGDGDSAPGGSQNEDEPLLPRVKTLPRGSDGWVFLFPLFYLPQPSKICLDIFQDPLFESNCITLSPMITSSSFRVRTSI